MKIQYKEPAVKENTYDVAAIVFDKYFHRISTPEGKSYYINAALKTTNEKFIDETYLSKDEYKPIITLPEGVTILSQKITDTAVPSNKKVKLVLSDGTEFNYSLIMR